MSAEGARLMPNLSGERTETKMFYVIIFFGVALSKGNFFVAKNF